MNIAIYCPLSGSTYIKLHKKLRNLKKDLIDIKAMTINVIIFIFIFIFSKNIIFINRFLMKII